MTRLNTPITGISTHSPYTDGECYSLVNLRPENGTLHPVPPRKVTEELLQSYDIIYVHQNGNYKNRIGVRHISDSLSQVYDNIAATPNLIAILPKITSLQQIGNTLSLITVEGIRYLLYDGNTYKMLGAMPEIKKTGYRIESIQTRDISFSDAYGSATPENIQEAIVGLFNRAIEGLNEDVNYNSEAANLDEFYNAVQRFNAQRYWQGPMQAYRDAANNRLSSVYERFDSALETINRGITAGKEVSKEHLDRATGNIDAAARELSAIADFPSMDDFTNDAIRLADIAGNYLNLAITDMTDPNLFYAFNTSKPGMYLTDAHLLVFAFRLYDGSTVKHSSPVLLCPSREDNISETILLNGNTVRVMAYRVSLDIDATYLTEWKDIIHSIDIFLSPGLGYNSASNIVTIPSVPGASLWLLKNQSTMIRNMEECSNFYLIDSIDAGLKDSAFGIPKNTRLDSLNILTAKEGLKLDSFSHHSVTGNVSFTYNHRLHLANITTVLFGGFDFGHFEMEKTKFNGYKFADYEQYIFDGYALKGVMIEVDLKTEGGTKTVRSRYSPDATFHFWLNPYFSYPDSRAFKARFYYEHPLETGGQYALICQMPLKPSNYLNLSYHISTNDDRTEVMPPIPNGAITKVNFANASDTYRFESGSEYRMPENIPVTYTEPGKLKVSELDNPFVFPNKNTYLTGNGSILAMATIAIRIPEGSYGQYPLYVFTTNGIYALSTGTGDVLYASQSTPTSYEIPVNSIVCQTPFGVAFVSSRGICIISGQQVELLTPQLHRSPQTLNLQSEPYHEGVLLNFPANFTEFLKTIEHIIYNPSENELIMHDRDSGFGYVYCFDSRQFYQTTERFDIAIQNTFPELLVVEGRKVKDWSQSQSSAAQVSLITRPLLFGTPDIKRMERLILRGTLLNIQNPATGKYSFLLNYCSMDGVNFRILRGIGLNPVSRKDIDTGLLAGSAFRQFLTVFAGVLDEKSEIGFLDTEIEKEYPDLMM